MDKELWRPTIGVFAVIYNPHSCEQVLLSKREDGRWNLPGGGIKSGEDMKEALKREVLEETGLEIEPHKLLGVYRGSQIDTLVLVFSCFAFGGSLKKYNPSEVVDNVFMGKRQIEMISADDIVPKQLEVLEDLFAERMAVVREKNGQRIV